MEKRELEDKGLTSELSNKNVNEVPLEEKKKIKSWLSQPLETLKILENVEVANDIEIVNVNVINEGNVGIIEGKIFSKSSSVADEKPKMNIEENQLNAKEESSGLQEEKEDMIADKNNRVKASYGQNAGLTQTLEWTDSSSMDIEKLSEVIKKEESMNYILVSKMTSTEQEFGETSLKGEDKIIGSLVTAPIEQTSSAKAGLDFGWNLEDTPSMTCEEGNQETVELNEKMKVVNMIKDDVQSNKLQSYPVKEIEDLSSQKVGRLETSKEESETMMKNIVKESQNEEDNKNEILQNIATTGKDDENHKVKRDVSFTDPKEGIRGESENLNPSEALTMERKHERVLVVAGDGTTLAEKQDKTETSKHEEHLEQSFMQKTDPTKENLGSSSNGASDEIETTAPDEYAETITNIEERRPAGDPEEILGERRKEETVMGDIISEEEIPEEKNLSKIDVDEKIRGAESKISNKNGNDLHVVHPSTEETVQVGSVSGDQVHEAFKVLEEEEKHVNETNDANKSPKSTILEDTFTEVAINIDVSLAKSEMYNANETIIEKHCELNSEDNLGGEPKQKEKDLDTNFQKATGDDCERSIIEEDVPVKYSTPLYGTREREYHHDQEDENRPIGSREASPELDSSDQSHRITDKTKDVTDQIIEEDSLNYINNSVYEDPEMAGTKEDTEKDINNEEDTVADCSPESTGNNITKCSQENEMEAKTHQAEMGELETNKGEGIQKQLLAEENRVQDRSIVSTGEELDTESPKEDVMMKKTSKEEFLEMLQTADGIANIGIGIQATEEDGKAKDSFATSEEEETKNECSYVEGEGKEPDTVVIESVADREIIKDQTTEEEICTEELPMKPVANETADEVTNLGLRHIQSLQGTVLNSDTRMLKSEVGELNPELEASPMTKALEEEIEKPMNVDTSFDDISEQNLQASSTQSQEEDNLGKPEESETKGEASNKGKTLDAKAESPLVAEKTEKDIIENKDESTIPGKDTIRGSTASEKESIYDDAQDEDQELSTPCELKNDKNISESDVEQLSKREKSKEVANSSVIGILKTLEEKSSNVELEKEKYEHVVAVNEASSSVEECGKCINTDKAIPEHGDSVNSEGSSKESADIERASVEFGDEVHSHGSEATNSSISTTTEMKTETVEHGEKLGSSPKSMTGDKNNRRFPETNQTSLEEESCDDMNSIIDSTKEEFSGQQIPEGKEKMSKEMEPERETKREFNEIQGTILTAKVPIEIERPVVTEIIKAQPTKEESSSKEPVADERVNKVANLESTPIQNLEATGSSNNTEMVKSNVAKDLNQESKASFITKALEEETKKPSEVSSSATEVSEEKIKEEKIEDAQNCDDETDTAPTIATDVANTGGVQLNDQPVEALDTSSDTLRLVRTKTTDPCQQDAEVDSMELEEISGTMSELPTQDHEKADDPETNQTSPEEENCDDVNGIIDSTKDEISGRHIQEGKEKISKEMEPERETKKEFNEIQDTILTAKVPIEIERPFVTEIIKAQTSKEESSAKEPVADETANRVVNLELTPSHNLEATVSSNNTEMVKSNVAKDLNQESKASFITKALEEETEKHSEVSISATEVSEEKIKEEKIEDAQNCDDETDTAPTMATDVTNTGGVPLNDQPVKALDTSSDTMRMVKTKTTDPCQQDTEVDSMKLEEIPGTMFEVPTHDHEKADDAEAKENKISSVISTNTDWGKKEIHETDTSPSVRQTDKHESEIQISEAPKALFESINQGVEAASDEKITSLGQVKLNDKPVNAVDHSSDGKSMETTKLYETSQQDTEVENKKLEENSSTVSQFSIHENLENDNESRTVEKSHATDVEVEEIDIPDAAPESENQAVQELHEASTSLITGDTDINKSEKHIRQVPDLFSEPKNQDVDSHANDVEVEESNIPGAAPESENQAVQEFPEGGTRLSLGDIDTNETENHPTKVPDSLSEPKNRDVEAAKDDEATHGQTLQTEKIEQLQVPSPDLLSEEKEAETTTPVMEREDGSTKKDETEVGSLTLDENSGIVYQLPMTECDISNNVIVEQSDAEEVAVKETKILDAISESKSQALKEIHMVELVSPSNVNSQEIGTIAASEYVEETTNTKKDEHVGSTETVTNVINTQTAGEKNLSKLDLDEIEIPNENVNYLNVIHPPVEETVQLGGESQDEVSLSESGDHEALEITKEDEKHVTETNEASKSKESTILEHMSTEGKLAMEVTSTSEMDVKLEKDCEVNSEDILKEINAEENIKEETGERESTSHTDLQIAIKFEALENGKNMDGKAEISLVAKKTEEDIAEDKEDSTNPEMDTNVEPTVIENKCINVNVWDEAEQEFYARCELKNDKGISESDVEILKGGKSKKINNSSVVGKLKNSEEEKSSDVELEEEKHEYVNVVNESSSNVEECGKCTDTTSEAILELEDSVNSVGSPKESIEVEKAPVAFQGKVHTHVSEASRNTSTSTPTETNVKTDEHGEKLRSFPEFVTEEKSKGRFPLTNQTSNEEESCDNVNQITEFTKEEISGQDIQGGEKKMIKEMEPELVTKKELNEIQETILTAEVPTEIEKPVETEITKEQTTKEPHVIPVADETVNEVANRDLTSIQNLKATVSNNNTEIGKSNVAKDLNQESEASPITKALEEETEKPEIETEHGSTRDETEIGNLMLEENSGILYQLPITECDGANNAIVEKSDEVAVKETKILDTLFESKGQDFKETHMVDLASPTNVGSEEIETTSPSDYVEMTTNIEEKGRVGSTETITTDDINEDSPEKKNLSKLDLEEMTSADVEIPNNGNYICVTHPPLEETVQLGGENHYEVSASELGDHETFGVTKEEENHGTERHEAKSQKSTTLEHISTEETIAMEVTSTSEMDVKLEKGCKVNLEGEVKETNAEEHIKDEREQKEMASDTGFQIAMKSDDNEKTTIEEDVPVIDSNPSCTGEEEYYHDQEDKNRPKRSKEASPELASEDQSCTTSNDTKNTNDKIRNKEGIQLYKDLKISDIGEDLTEGEEIKHNKHSVTDHSSESTGKHTTKCSDKEKENREPTTAASEVYRTAIKSTTTEESAITDLYLSFVGEEKLEESIKKDKRDSIISENEVRSTNKCMEQTFDTTCSTKEISVEDETETNEGLNSHSITGSSKEEIAQNDRNLDHVEKSKLVPKISKKEIKEEILGKADSKVIVIAEETRLTQDEAEYVMQIDSFNLVSEEKGSVTTETSETGSNGKDIAAEPEETSSLGENDTKFQTTEQHGTDEASEKTELEGKNKTCHTLSKTDDQKEQNLGRVETSMDEKSEENHQASLWEEHNFMTPEASEMTSDVPNNDKKLCGKAEHEKADNESITVGKSYVEVEETKISEAMSESEYQGENKIQEKSKALSMGKNATNPSSEIENQIIKIPEALFKPISQGVEVARDDETTPGQTLQVPKIKEQFQVPPSAMLSMEQDSETIALLKTEDESRKKHDREVDRLKPEENSDMVSQLPKTECASENTVNVERSDADEVEVRKSKTLDAITESKDQGFEKVHKPKTSPTIEDTATEKIEEIKGVSERKSDPKYEGVDTVADSKTLDHEESVVSKEQQLQNIHLTLPPVTDAAAEEAQDEKVDGNFEEASNTAPKGQTHGSMETNEESKEIYSIEISYSESFKGNEKLECTSLEPACEGSGVKEDLDHKKQEICSNKQSISSCTSTTQEKIKDEKQLVFLSNKQTTDAGSILEEAKSSQFEEKHPKDEDPVELSTMGNERKLDEAKIHVTNTENEGLEAQHQKEESNVLSQVKEFGKEVPHEKSIMDLSKVNELTKVTQELKKASLAISHEQKAYPSESTETTNPTASKYDPVMQDYPTTDGFNLTGYASGSAAEENGVKCGEEKTADEESEETIKKSMEIESAKISLSDLLQTSTKQTLQVVEHLIEQTELTSKKEEVQTGAAETIEVEEAKTDEEEGDEHIRVDLGSDAPVNVEATSETDVKIAHKKSHNILSGVGSKVKHSLAKVKKVITGKSPHEKPSSPK